LDATDIIFRNQGWAGDTVQGIARAVFGTPEDGFARLLRDLRQVEPTHILIAYGNNEAHDGVENLDHFVRHWHRLLDELSATGARLIVLLPPRRIRPTSALPDPAEYNSNLDQYRNVMLQTCQQRKIASLDLALSEAWKYTTDGIRLTPTGYWILAQDLASYLGYPQPPWELHLDANRRSYDAVNVSVQQLFFTTNQVRWVSVDRYLPVQPPALL
jgi:lysophospholipase L1-like esterase